MQPAHDFIKFLNKATSLPTTMRLIPLLAVLALLLILVLLPQPGSLAADSSTTSGDLLAIVFLLLLPRLAPVFLGNLLALPYARILAQRTSRRVGVIAGLLLLGVLALAAQRGSLSLALLTIQQTQPEAINSMLDALAGLIFLLCLPALIPLANWNGFHGSSKLIAGPSTDLAGADLVLVPLGAALQRVAAGSNMASITCLRKRNAPVPLSRRSREAS